MYDLITAVTLARQGKYLFMDPTYNEESFCSSLFTDPNDMETNEEKEHGIILLSILSSHQQISELYQTGCFSLETIISSINLLTEANKQIVPLTQKCLVDFVMKYKGNIEIGRREYV